MDEKSQAWKLRRIKKNDHLHLHIFSILIRSDDFYKKSFLIILFSETRGIIKYIYIFFQKIKYSDRQGLIDTIIDINRRIKMSYRSHWS